MKLDISVVNGWTRLGVFSFDAYHKAAGLPADKIYHNRMNFTYCKELGIRLSGLALGRPK